MTEPPDPNKTYAVIVGIDSYEYHRDLVLTGLSERAFQFAKWLRYHEVPKENIGLFVSSSKQEEIRKKCQEEQIQLDVDLAKHDIVNSFLDDKLYLMNGISEDQDLLYVFWAGHGIITGGGKRKEVLNLPYEDFNLTGKTHNLDLFSLAFALEYPGRERRGFKAQIYLIEACQTIKKIGQDLPSWFQTYTKDFEATPEGSNLRQYHIYSTLKGKPSINNGKFSKVIINKLAECSLLPDMDDFYDRSNPQLEQQGIKTYRRSWQGSENGTWKISQSSVSEEKIGDDELFKELLKLNFRDEYTNFRIGLKDNPALMVWIGGRKDEGVQVLRDKLINPLINEDSTDAWPFIQLDGKEAILSSSLVWEKLAEQLKLRTSKSKEEVVSTLSQSCRERTIIITFEINKIPPILVENVVRIINDVYQSLVSNISPILKEKQDKKKEEKRTNLVIFFLDYGKQFKKYQNQQVCQLSSRYFQEPEINGWIVNAQEQFNCYRLPSSFEPEQSKTIYDEDSEKDGNKGNPRLVYKSIYQLLGVYWYDSKMIGRVE